MREDPAHKRADRHDFARDRARIVHSAALRRLAAKTQVVEPDADDFVRNRLTHSLEVAQIGREFGAALGCHADVVDAGCLAHDLGHPPFGHNGESALAEEAAAIGGFEGNAQTLRLLTRLEAKRFHADGRSAGLNLTRACLDAAVKYPWTAGDAPYQTHKFGAYAADAAAFGWLRDGAPEGRRCLEAQVMDWSDDVGYSVHDVEDAIAGDLVDVRVLHAPVELTGVYDVARQWYMSDVDQDVLIEATRRLVATGVVPHRYDGSRRALAALKDMTSRLIGRFVHASELATRARYGDGPLTRYAADLVVPDQVRAESALLKAVAAYFVMLHPDRTRARELERERIHLLVDAYRRGPEERLDPPFAADFAAAADDAARLRVIVDQVASLTDIRAISLARRWGRSTGVAEPPT